MSKTLYVVALALVSLTLDACGGGVQSTTGPTAINQATPLSQSATIAAAAGHVHGTVAYGTAMTQSELARVRTATARYQDHSVALADGYSLLLPVGGQEYVPHMGRHYLNLSLIDAPFDPERPPVLLYVPGPNGRHRLVAVEYGVPVADLNNPGAPPTGFSGDHDAWSINTEFSIWALHAWVWEENPDGMFAPFNPRVP
jgi:hypothetical protein